MGGDWDDALKIYIGENAQDLLEWIYGKRIVVKRKLQTEFKVRTIEADSMFDSEVMEFEGEEEGEPVLFHIEVQSTNDPEMPERMLGYSYSARRAHHREVYSSVLYLRNVGTVPQSPLEWKQHGRTYMFFDYTVVDLSKVPFEELRQTGRINLLPLLVLTNGGANRSRVEEVITELGGAKKADLLFATKLFADLVFKDEEDQQWLERIFAMYRDPLVQTPTYQKILREGREKGREEGKLEALQQSLLDVVEVRFPSLTELARERVQRASKPDVIESVFKTLVTTPDENAARALLEVLAA
jgi:predicted transposase/invertase (TIGR01784 family)